MMSTARTSLRRIAALTPLVLLACPSAQEQQDSAGTETQTDSGGASDDVLLGACDRNARVGGFDVALEDTYTAVQGRVESGQTPFRKGDPIASEGACTLYRPPSLFCDPPCTGGLTCDFDGACIDAPIPISVGTVDVSGLSDPVQMQASAPAFYYTFVGTLAHPAFAVGDPLVLHASGSEGVASFDLDARGIAALSTSVDVVELAVDQAVTVAWAAGDESSSIHAVLNIANHGGNPGWIECELPDDGQLEIPVPLTNQLLQQGFSGFPSLVLTRRSGDSVQSSAGCIDFVASSTVALAVSIEGLTSCSSNDDCTAPETCQADLTCG